MKLKICKAKKRCTLCGKKLDLWDEQENFCFDRKVGYGSKHDGCQIKFQLCCGCFDRMVDMFAPLCKTDPITDPYAWWEKVK